MHKQRYLSHTCLVSHVYLFLYDIPLDDSILFDYSWNFRIMPPGKENRLEEGTKHGMHKEATVHIETVRD